MGFMRLRIVKEYLGSMNHSISDDENNKDFQDLIDIYVWTNSDEEGYNELMMIKQSKDCPVLLFVEKKEFYEMYGQYGLRFIDKAEKLKEAYKGTFSVT